MKEYSSDFDSKYLNSFQLYLGSSSTDSNNGGRMNMQILSVVWQEYKYDWSEHMARDERFHPAIMVCVSILLINTSICFQ